jgi:tetratricopeptide (TPR) repeat protein
MRIPLSIFALLAALIGCAVTPNSEQLNAQANRAFYSGQLEIAAKAYSQAMTDAQKEGNKQYEAIAMYGLARTNAKLCHIAEADRWFRASIEARDKLPDDPYALITQNLVEYARFLMDTERPALAVPFMDRAIPKLDATGIQVTDPIAYAEFLEEYAKALTAAQRDAIAARNRAAALRAANPGKDSRFKPEHLLSNCSEKQ